MFSSLSALAVSAILGTAGTTGTVGNPLQIDAPQAPSVAITTLAPKAPESPTAPSVNPQAVPAPTVPNLDFTPLDCGASGCSTDDPTTLAGTVISLNAITMADHTDSGHTYSAVVDNDTSVICPSQQALDEGHVFNPVTPSIAAPGSGRAPATPQIKYQYQCTTANVAVGRHIVGAELGRDANGELHWIAIALAPS